MNRKIVSAAIAVAAFAGAAHAQGPIEQAEPFNSVRSRAEVQADLQQYKKAGINHASTWYNPLREFKSVRTREAATAVAAANAEQRTNLRRVNFMPQTRWARFDHCQVTLHSPGAPPRL